MNFALESSDCFFEAWTSAYLNPRTDHFTALTSYKCEEFRQRSVWLSVQQVKQLSQLFTCRLVLTSSETRGARSRTSLPINVLIRQNKRVLELKNKMLLWIDRRQANKRNHSGSLPRNITLELCDKIILFFWIIGFPPAVVEHCIRGYTVRYVKVNKLYVDISHPFCSFVIFPLST